MTKQFEVYKCEHCGTLLEVLHAGPVVPSCWGGNMKLMQ
jgi:superoxide reductase